ncbi:MAG: hypothetical protein RIR00_1777, partial [Pseudomonadota bacterium]
LRDYLGQSNLVLFFCPKMSSPCGIKEITEFSDHDMDFARHACAVVGVGRADCLALATLRDHEGIGIRLLADCDARVAKAYGAWQAREVDGHRKFGVTRSTFIIDRGGIVRHALYNINYKGHALDVLRLVKELDS